MPITARYNVAVMKDDMALKGWLQTDLARVADVTDMTVTRFFRCERQTNRTAKKLAKALGRPLSRYLIPSATHPEATL